MTTDLITTDTPPSPPTVYELGAMSTQQLRSELARSLTMTARHLTHLASIWGELEKRGEDLSDLRTGLAVYLPQIAAGKLDADAVIRFAGQPTVLRNIASLPRADQQRLASGASVQVLTVNAVGEYEATDMPAHALTASQARLLIDGGKLRSFDEQRALMDTVRVAAKRRSVPGRDSRVRYDPKTEKIRIGNTSATVGEIMGAIVAASSAPDTASDPDKTIIIKLLETELKGLKIRAAQAGMTQQDYVRALLVMQNIL